ncbi:MAG TPA: hypothetical protein VKK81_08040 [Candidatus Binatia bacterium]|nr:hypothetical protein [Candidatus Binatia bacterium]
MAAIMGIAGKLGVTYAAPAGGTAIHIHGTVSNPDLGLAVAINIDVAGPHGDLSGAGWDLPGAPLSFDGVCYYTQAGSVHGNTVHLEGNALLANTPTDVGAPVITDANLATGAITWQIGPFVFQGVGTVIHK